MLSFWHLQSEVERTHFCCELEGMDASGSGDPSGTSGASNAGGGRGVVMGRRLPASITPGRLPAMRSRDLTLGGVKKVNVYIKTTEYM